MPDHLSPLGFQIKTVEAFEELAHMAVEQGTPTLSTHGSYVHWSWGDAIEFWTQADKTLQLTGCHPFYDGGRPATWTPQSWHADPEHPLDGVVVAQPEPKDGQGWVMQVPDFDRHAHDQSPTQMVVAIFIHEVNFLDDEEDPIPLSYTPLHWPDEREPFVPAHGKITARIEHSVLAQNRVSKGRYWHLTLHTSAGLIDAVCASGNMRKRPRVGATIEIQGWVTGRPTLPIEDAQETSS